MKDYQFYPVNRIPQKISEAKNYTIPAIPLPQKPAEPASEPMRYFGLIAFCAVIVITVLYKFGPLPSVPWFTGVLAASSVISCIFLILNLINNKVREGSNKKKRTDYAYIMRNYLEEMKKYDEIRVLNTDSAALNKFRNKQVAEVLMTTVRSLKPVTAPGPKYFECFYQKLKGYFPDGVLINYTIEQPQKKKPFIPNYIVALSDFKLYIDIEIDAPYSLDERKPVSFVDNYNRFNKQNHDDFFINAGWIVIRFAEEQVIKHSESCCKHIAQIIFEITDDNSLLQRFNTVDPVPPIEMWTYKRAVELESEQYREHYLPPKPENKTEDEFLNSRNHEDFVHESKKIEPEIQPESEPEPEPEKTTEQNEKDKPEPEKTVEQNNREADKLELQVEKQNVENPEPEIVETSVHQQNVDVETPTVIEAIEVNAVDASPKMIQNDKIIEEHTTSDLVIDNEKSEKKSDDLPLSHHSDNNADYMHVIEEIPAESNIVDQDIKPVNDIKIADTNSITFESEKSNDIPPEDLKKHSLVELVSKMNEYHRTENWEMLLETCDKVIELDDTFQLAYLRKSTALGNSGRFEEALLSCRKVMELAPDNPDAFYNAAIACMMLKRYNEATENFEKAIRRKIGHVDEIFFTMSGLYRKSGDQGRFKEYLQLSANAGNEKAKALLMSVIKNENNDGNNSYKSLACKKIKAAREGVSDICFSTDDVFTAVADLSRKLRIYRTSDWQQVYGEDVSVTAMAFGRNTKYMAVGGHSYLRILRIDGSQFSLYTDITNYTGVIKKMFFHPFSSDVLFISDNFAVYKVDLRTKVINKIVRDFQLCCVSKDMQYFAGKDYFNNIIVYRINVLSEIFRLKVDNRTSVKAMALSTDASKLIFADSDKNVHIYNTQLPAKISVSTLESKPVELKISNDSKFYVVITDDRVMRFFNVSNSHQYRILPLKTLPKVVTMSNVNNYLGIGNFTEDVEIFFTNDVESELKNN